MSGDVPHSSVESIEWPAVVTDNAAMLLALQHELDASQWWPPERHAEHQFRQLRHLVAHAYRTVPFYRPRLDALSYRPGQEIGPDFWRLLPVLNRRDLGESFAGLISTAIPASHGEHFQDVSSGSTGTPVKVMKTTIADFFWRGFTLREELWHRRDWSRKIAIIRAGYSETAPYPAGAQRHNWGPPVAVVYPSGPMSLLSISTEIEDQAAWLIRENPAYLLTVPSNLAALAAYFRANRLALPGLREVRTIGEVVDHELRDACRAAWGAELTDVYSCMEAGYIALQCPEYRHYHVQAESALLEVLDEGGAPCGPGEQGRVVLTPLHNFAMPLLRYAVGDIAEMGEPCPCGRGLPVIARILGRVRETLVLPSGARRYPTGWYEPFAALEGLVQYQIVQKSVEALEVRLVTRPPFSPVDEDKMRQVLHALLGPHFKVAFTYLDAIPRAPSGKFFEFLSEIAD